MKVGLIGAGYWGSKVLREYLQLRETGKISEVFVCDKDAAAIARAKKLGRLDATTPSLKTLLSKVDAIHIATRNDQHFAVAKQALEAGVHVLVEKPMTTSSHEAYDLAERASAAGLVLQAGHIYRFNNALRKVGELLQKKHFGPVYYYKFQWTTRMPAPEGLDIVWDLLPHPLDMMHLLTGAWPREYVGVARSYRRRAPAEVAFVTALYGHETTANFELSWLRPVRSRTLEIVGEKRDAVVDCVAQTIEILEDGRSTTVPVHANNTILEEVAHFVQSIRTGKNPHNSAIVGARNVQAIELALQSMR